MLQTNFLNDSIIQKSKDKAISQVCEKRKLKLYFFLNERHFYEFLLASARHTWGDQKPNAVFDIHVRLKFGTHE